MSTLPPLSNFFAIFLESPEARLDMRKSMEASGEFDDFWEPAPGWLVGHKQLPLNKAVPEAARRNGLVFAEGALAMAGDRLADPEIFYRDFASFVDSSPEKLAQYPGDFTFLRFRADGTVTAVRACAGLAPLYYANASGIIAFGTRLGYFSELLNFTQLDTFIGAVQMGFSFLFIDRRTPLKGVHCLRRAEALCVVDGRLESPVPYWTCDRFIPSKSADLQEEEHASELRSLLLSNLETNTLGNETDLFSLSTGNDSSSLVALARLVLKRNFLTLSFLAGEGSFLDNDRGVLERFEKNVGIKVTWLRHLSARQRINALQNDNPFRFPVAHPVILEIPQLLKERVIYTLTGGEFADEICGSHPALHDWNEMASFVRVAKKSINDSRLRRPCLRLIKYRVLRPFRQVPLPFVQQLDRRINPAIRDEYSEWLERFLREMGGPKPRYFLLSRFMTSEFSTMNWEALSNFGIRRNMPFFSREMVELAFRCHPEEVIEPGYKRMLRKAMDGYVPAETLYRNGKDIWRTPDESDYLMEEPLSPAILDCFSDPQSYEKGKAIPRRWAAKIMVMDQYAKYLEKRACVRGE